MDSPEQQSNLPKNLEKQFNELESALFRKETSLAFMTAICTVIVSIGVLFISDRFWDSPKEIRLFLLIGAGLGVLASIVVWMRNWRWDPRGNISLSRLIQFAHRRFGDRLRGAVELADGDDSQPRMSPALRRAAIQQVADGAQDFDFTSVVDLKPLRRMTAFFIAVLIAASATAFIAPKASWNSFVRWLMPGAAIERFTFVSLSEIPDQMIVLHGNEFHARAKVGFRGFWKPTHAMVQFESQPPIEAEVSEGWIQARIPGQTANGELKIVLGDSEASTKVLPTHPPAIQTLEAKITLPEYLQHPETTKSFAGLGLTVVEESTLTLYAEANRDLASVRFWSTGAEALDLAIQGSEFATPKLEPFGELKGVISIEDQLGLSNNAPRPFQIRTRPDEPPNVELLGLSPSLSILESDVLPLRLYASDDFGVKLAGVAWKLIDAGTNELTIRELKTELTNTTSIEFTNTYIFSPTVLGIPPETTIELRAAALDYYPDREPSQSSSYRIHIIGNIRHAKMVKDQLEGLFAEVEEITRTEEGIAQQTSELKNKSAKPDKPNENSEGEEGKEGRPGENEPTADEDSKAAQKLAEQQEQNNRHLQSIARTGQRILEEAIRNPMITEKTLKEWTENISSMQQLAQQQMKESARELRNAQGQPQKSQQQQNLAKAEDAQQEALQKLQEMQQRINSGLDNLEALTLAERLRGLAMKEDGIVSQMRAVIVETLGLRPYELEERHRTMNNRLAKNQREVGEESGTVQDEIGRFFDRTQRPNYGEVNREMRDAKTPIQLAELGALIDGNISMESIQDMRRWMRRLNAWADVLDPPEESESNSGSGQPGNAEQQQKLIKMLLAFIRIRMNEVTLHQRTVMLDQDRERANYADTAKKLSSHQRFIRQNLLNVAMDNEHDIMKELLTQGQAEMINSERGLREPATGKPTQDAQIAGIQHLSDLINLINEEAKRNQRNQQQQNQQQQQAMQQMQMLMRLAQQQMRSAFSRIPGMNPGGNPAGGGTGQAGMGQRGANDGTGEGERGTDRASGRTRQIPAEFREIMERYFEAVEKEL
ncbi:MAG: hypothetical protein CMO80_01600 [Verrucomicrobiales bacterium]|nr:hypothetical protein [Verrucomicrobiales bacterium]|tara:strand:+ start:11079 stop:14246 length:3168 start_codon:yes stop_codon:yes gene_type:complete